MKLLSLAIGLTVGVQLHGQIPDRVENTSLVMPPALFTSVAYELEDLEPGELGHPLVMTSPPGDTRLFVVDRVGIIRVIDDLDDPSPRIYMDIRERVESGFLEEGLLGLAFHPDFAQNGHFYVTYTRRNPDPEVVHDDVLARFTISSSDPEAGDPDSESILIQEPGDPYSRNHNGGDLHFHEDGLLYVSLGDGGYSGSAQEIDGDFHAALMRIDVDGLPTSLTPNPHDSSSANYWIPFDNPFVGVTEFNGASVEPDEVRTEFFAVGLRNPWRFSIDPVSGDIILGDVGEDSFEEINLITAGGNYGWPFREGPNANEGTPPAEANFIDPIHAYGRDKGLSVIGGFIYRGDRLPELNGHYIFTDWGNGEIRALLPNGQQPVSARAIASSYGFGPTAFAQDPRNGDLLVSHDSIRRLVRRDEGTVDSLPTKLSSTGAFSDLDSLTPNPGIIPYEINLPFWSDDAHKSRWFSLPDPDLEIGFNAPGAFAFPSSSVWIKHFDIEMTAGDPETLRRLETRFLVRNDEGVYGVTYRWNPEGTDADLVPETGATEELLRIIDGETVSQTWEYPSRADCLSCHSRTSGWALGFDSTQLNREVAYGSETHNQLPALQAMGYFSGPIPPHRSLPALAAEDEEDISLEFRARSYLHANCAQCHHDGGIATWDARLDTPLAESGIIDGLLNDNQGVPANRVIAPGDETHSMILNRISTRGSKQMPPLASHLVDEEGVSLIREWILSLADYQSYDQWSQALSGEILPEDGDFDHDGLSNGDEYGLGFSLVDPSQRWLPARLSHGNPNSGPSIHFQRVANRAFRLEFSDTLDGNWSFLDVPGNEPAPLSQGGEATLIDPAADLPHRFYRVRWLPQ